MKNKKDMTFATNLKMSRYRLYLSQREFCKKANMNFGIYCAWETGRNLPNLENMQKLLQTLSELGVPSAQIVDLRNTYFLEKAEKYNG